MRPVTSPLLLFFLHIIYGARAAGGCGSPVTSPTTGGRGQRRKAGREEGEERAMSGIVSTPLGCC